ncbi:MAG: protein translocase SEC61 complex subunit gamma [Nanoarchaeota archaeon]
MYQKFKNFFNQSLRVWRVLRKPSGEEFKLVAKVSAIGVLLLGFCGFAVSLIMKAIV